VIKFDAEGSIENFFAKLICSCCDGENFIDFLGVKNVFSSEQNMKENFILIFIMSLP